jgi:hypothetical protein
MYKLDEVKAKKILIDELGYKPHEATFFLKDFPPLHEDLKDSVENWLVDRTILDVKVGGVQIKDVMHSQGYHFLLAVRELNGLLDKNLSHRDRERLAKILLSPPIRR